MQADGYDDQPPMSHRQMRPSSAPSGSVGRGDLSIHESFRAKKKVEDNCKMIENRIRYFQREEEKIWRDLEEVRRQAAMIEDGRSRKIEKNLADRTIQQERELVYRQNQARAAQNRGSGIEVKKRNALLSMKEKQIAGEEQRRTSQDILRQKRMQETQSRLANSERAVAIQRAQLESRLKANQEKAMRIERLKQEQELERQMAEAEVGDMEERLPQLEAEEMLCLQRLQNSRIVTQSVLEELESSLGKRSSVTTLLRSKQRGQDFMGSSLAPAEESVGSADQSYGSPPREAGSPLRG
jgi:hypothetical protein